jgi:hypothetical protein
MCTKGDASIFRWDKDDVALEQPRIDSRSSAATNTDLFLLAVGHSVDQESDQLRLFAKSNKHAVLAHPNHPVVVAGRIGRS